MAYKLLEFGGKANVVLRANIDMDINGNHYDAGDIVFLFDGVDLDFQYNEKVNDKSVAKQNQLSYFERHINTISISGLSLTSNYIEVFGKKKAESFDRTVIETTTITDKKWYSLQKPSQDKIFILNDKQYEIEVDEEYNEITIKTEDELVDGEYTIAYYTSIESPVYDINNIESIPYMSMEILGLGNLDKKDGNIYIKIPKVNLINRPDYSLSERITAQDMVFKVIQDTILMGVY